MEQEDKLISAEIRSREEAALKEVLAEKGSNLSTLSVELGKDKSYLSQYFTRGTPKTLPRKLLRQIHESYGVRLTGFILPDPIEDMIYVYEISEENNQLFINKTTPIKKIKRIPDFISQPNSFAVFMPHSNLQSIIPQASLLFIDHAVPPKVNDRIYVECTDSMIYIGILINATSSEIHILTQEDGLPEIVQKSSVFSSRKISYIKFP